MKSFSCTVFTILLLSSFPSSTDGGKVDLFQKVGAKQMRFKKTAANFCLTGLSGQKVELKNHKGEVTFLNFRAEPGVVLVRKRSLPWSLYGNVLRRKTSSS